MRLFLRCPEALHLTLKDTEKRLFFPAIIYDAFKCIREIRLSHKFEM